MGEIINCPDFLNKRIEFLPQT